MICHAATAPNWAKSGFLWAKMLRRKVLHCVFFSFHFSALIRESSELHQCSSISRILSVNFRPHALADQRRAICDCGNTVSLFYKLPDTCFSYWGACLLLSNILFNTFCSSCYHGWQWHFSWIAVFFLLFLWEHRDHSSQRVRLYISSGHLSRNVNGRWLIILNFMAGVSSLVLDKRAR